MARARRPNGVPALAAGLAFGAAGVGLLLAAAAGGLDAPPLLLAVFAAAFLGGGLQVGLGGWRGARRARQAALHPEEPWRFDRDWDPAGALDEAGAPARAALWQAIAATAFLLPFNALAALEPEAFPVAWMAIVDLGPALLLARAIALRIRRRRCGVSRLRFHEFPYFLGRPFAATLELSQRAPLVRALEVTLSCEERRDWEGEAGGGAKAPGVEVELYRATQVTRGARSLPLRFELPSDERPLETDLAGFTPRRWRLRVRGQATGVGFDSTFLLPIYAPPRPVGAEGETGAGGGLAGGLGERPRPLPSGPLQ